MKTNHTAQVVTTAPVEWLSPKQACCQFSIGRSSLYALLTEGRIKSVALRVRGNTRGKRLISAESLRMFIESGGEG